MTAEGVAGVATESAGFAGFCVLGVFIPPCSVWLVVGGLVCWLVLALVVWWLRWLMERWSSPPGVGWKGDHPPLRGRIPLSDS